MAENPSITNPERVLDALVQFFDDVDKQSKTFQQIPDETAIYLAVAFDIEFGEPRDVLRGKIARALGSNG